MHHWKRLGRQLQPAQLGLVSCFCVTAFGFPLAVVGSSPSQAQASPRTGSSSGRLASLADASPHPDQIPASPSSSGGAPQPQGSLSSPSSVGPVKMGNLNLASPVPPASRAVTLPRQETILKVGEQHQQTQQPPATLYSYQLDGQQVVTVYLRDLPVVSFVEQPQLAPPLERATSLVAQLNQLAQSHLHDTTISLDWATAKSSDQAAAAPLYAIYVNGKELLRIDEGVLLVDNQRPVDTAVLAANRLRRLLLDAPPLQARDVPQPPALAATAQPPEAPPQKSATASPPQVSLVQEGIASWYNLHSSRHEMTAAHPTLPFGTRVRVTNMDNGRQAIVRINDRGPFIPGRIIDLSVRAAEVLGIIRSGLAPVRVEVVQP